MFHNVPGSSEPNPHPPHYWPCKLALSSPGFIRQWRPIRALRDQIEAANLQRLLNMSVDEQVELILAPITFGPTACRVSEQLDVVAAIADVDQRAALLCLVAGEELRRGECDLVDLSSEEVNG